MALYDTAANIINDVAIEAFGESTADPYGSTDAKYVQLRTLLKSVGRGLLLRNTWLQFVKEHSFTTTSSASYALPADFQSMIDQSGWNRTTVMPMNPATPQQWQYLKALPNGLTWTVIFKPHDTTLELWPQPVSAGNTIAFEYRSRYWVQPSGQTSPTADAPTANTDTICLDVQLVTRAVKLAFLRAKGFPTDAAQMDFQQAFDDVRSANVGAAPVLSIVGRRFDLDPPEAGGFATGGIGAGFDGEGGLY